MSKRRVIAAAAVLGIGAAGTAAMWTNNAIVVGTAELGRADVALDLEVAYGADWQDPTTPPTGLYDFLDSDKRSSTSTTANPRIPASAFGDVLPGIESSQIVWLRNNGTEPVNIAESIEFLPSVSKDVETYAEVTTDVPATMEPGDVVPVTVTLAGAPDMPTDADGSADFAITWQATLQGAATE